MENNAERSHVLTTKHHGRFFERVMFERRQKKNPWTARDTARSYCVPSVRVCSVELLFVCHHVANGPIAESVRFTREELHRQVQERYVDRARGCEPSRGRTRMLGFLGSASCNIDWYNWSLLRTLRCARKLNPGTLRRINRRTPHRWREQVGGAETTESFRELHRRLLNEFEVFDVAEVCFGLAEKLAVTSTILRIVAEQALKMYVAVKNISKPTRQHFSHRVRGKLGILSFISKLSVSEPQEKIEIVTCGSERDHLEHRRDERGTVSRWHRGREEERQLQVQEGAPKQVCLHCLRGHRHRAISVAQPSDFRGEDFRFAPQCRATTEHHRPPSRRVHWTSQASLRGCRNDRQSDELDVTSTQ